MNGAGVVTMWTSFSTTMECTEPNSSSSRKHGAYVRSATPRSRGPVYQFDMNFAKSFRFTKTRCGCRFVSRLQHPEPGGLRRPRQYENNATNSLFGTIDKSVIRQSNFPRYGQLGIKLIF